MEKIGSFHTVWGDVEATPNIELCFCCSMEAHQDAVIELVAKDIYNLYINGSFVAYGPSRAAKGYVRVERIDISSYLTKQKNMILVYVQANHVDMLYMAKEQPLFGARILTGARILKETKDFSCHQMTDKISRVERMSSQRGFLEVYRMQQDRQKDIVNSFPKIQTRVVACPKLMERGVSYARNIMESAKQVNSGYVHVGETRVWENGFTKLLDSGKGMGGYKRNECECVLSTELLSFYFKDYMSSEEKTQQERDCEIYSLDRVLCGKFKVKVSVSEQSVLWLTYDDLLVDGSVKFNREHIIHGMKWTLEPGEYTLYSQEVYSAKYIQLIADGEVDIKEVSMIRIENPCSEGFVLPSMDAELQMIVDAAKNTFAQNAYDLFTDCPSRERAGWLCDSYFMGKAEQFFCGDNKVEKNFLENYFLYEDETAEHKGILPMCYPSSRFGDEDYYIPNWILWYILELEDYQKRTGDTEFIRLHRQRILDILEFFGGYENEFGLLENLEGWVFLEWSKASDFVDGVNFPSNMLYADALRAASMLLENEKLLKKSETLKECIRGMAYNGEVFVDNAVRVNGELRLTGNISELCQIFVIFFGIVQNDNDFYESFKNRFAESGYKDEIHPSAMFIGGILRLLVLFDLGEYELLLAECKDKFSNMAEKTGTIWEFYDENASCNHGFGSILGKLICESAERLRSVKGVTCYETK